MSANASALPGEALAVEYGLKRNPCDPSQLNLDAAGSKV